MINKEHLTEEGLQKIVAIRASLNWGLTDKLTAAFPSIVPVRRPSNMRRAPFSEGKVKTKKNFRN